MLSGSTTTARALISSRSSTLSGRRFRLPRASVTGICLGHSGKRATPIPDPLQPGQAQAGDAAEIRRWVVALVDEVTAIGLESVVHPVPSVAYVHVPHHVGLR